MGQTSYVVFVRLSQCLRRCIKMSNEERPTGTMFVIGVLVATILVFWGSVFYLFIQRG